MTIEFVSLKKVKKKPQGIMRLFYKN